MTRDHGAPYYHIHRADYQAMLHRLTRTAPGVRTCLGAPFAPSNPARRRTTARCSITRHLTLSRPMWSASSRGFALKRRSDCVRVTKPMGRDSWKCGEPFELVAKESADSGQVKREHKKRAQYVRGSSRCYVLLLRGDSSEMTGLGRGYAVHFYACL